MTFSETDFYLNLNSQPENITEVEPFVRKIRSSYPLSDDQYFDILLVLTEAVNNSILHGNGADPHKNVSVKFAVSNRQYRFTITDEGKGFNPEEIPDPTTPDRINTPCGRGVFLMKKLSDSIRYSNKGRTVNINFSIR